MTTIHDELAVVLVRAQRGDEEAFRELYRTVQPALLRYLRVLVGDDAEDVASEAWLQIARDLSKFCGTADKFRGWCATIARNRAMDHLRRRRSRPVAADSLLELFVNLPAPDDTARSACDLVDGDAALALIATLPPDQAEAVMLRVIVGLDAETAAAVLGKRAGAVRTAAYRGLKNLAQRLATQENDPDQGVTSAQGRALKNMR
ncbi:RNA polymerase sigma factor [Sporichthya sp.]|uniref:RNA polymerase sigma factor n=1 Tax=Sporichthya sp. TaxID=65475 RepID=UPI0017B052B8|nr:RNA polymerase sigma factor [Sporichthya sp.]MBA3743669.1 RNA polymerase sigma factor [Sporichthya sp.]